MSGPKVVRIVTEEERVAICNAQLALLKAEVQSLLEYLRSHGIDDQNLVQKLKDKISFYEKELTSEKYHEAQAIVERELDFLSFEFDRLRTRELEKAQSKQMRALHLLESSKTLHMLASSLSTDVTPNLELKYSQVINKSDAEILALEKKVSLEFSKLSEQHTSDQVNANLTLEQQETKDRLTSVDKGLSVSEWKLVNAKSSDAVAKHNRIDIVMADLDELQFPLDKKADYQKKLDIIFEEKSIQRRTLLLDSLVISLAQDANDYKQLKKARHELRKINAQLEALEGEQAKQLSTQIERALELEDVSILERVQETVSKKLAQMMSALSIERGREELLLALKSLGYSINEGMETAVVENGRIIVKKPVQQAYGVEVQEIGVTGKFQLRLVSGIPDSERSAREDIEEEEKWCEDLAKIRDLLKEAEIELEIEKALEPGSATVKYSETISNSLSQSRHRQSNLKTKKIER